MKYSATFRMNGVGHAFLRELGCKCPQCIQDKPRAHTSGSLIFQENNTIIYHVLFDCGSGTTDSLILNNLNKVDCIFNTHNHLDHIADLDRLINSLKRNNKSFNKIPFYCTQGTWDKGINSLYPWLVGNILHKNISIEVEKSIPTYPFDDTDTNLKVTPIPVYHGKFAYEPVIFIIEFGNDENYKRLILCWDFLHLINDYSNKNEYDAKYNRENPGDNINPEKIQFHSNHLLNGADALFIAGNTITPEFTGHASIIACFELIRSITPKQTFIVHYSGHEDQGGPLTDDQLQLWIDKNKIGHGLAEQTILVAKHGMELKY